MVAQWVLDELREIADKIDREAGQSSRWGQMDRLEGLAQQIRDCADTIGDD